jgi:hypothetical protein
MTGQSTFAVRLHSGQRLSCRVCSANVLVVAPGTATDLPYCDGTPMQPGSVIPCGAACHADDATEVRGGVMYQDPVSSVTLRCTRPGRGPLTVEGRLMIPQRTGRWSR